LILKFLSPPVPSSARSAARRRHAIPESSAPVRDCTVAQVIGRWSCCGLELQLARQSPLLHRFGICSRILSSQPPESLAPLTADLYPIHGPQSRPDRRRISHWFAEQFRVMRADLVHVRGLWLLPDALRAARLAGDLPTVVSFHGFDDASRGASWWRRTRWRRALQFCERRIAVSRTTALDLSRTLAVPMDEIDVIYNGVDANVFSPTPDRLAARRSLRLTNDSPLLLCVGSLMPVKGHDFLIDALSTGPAAARPWQLSFVGQDAWEGTIQRLAAQRLPGRTVRFLGNQPDLLPFYRAADALIAPSRSEGCSNVLLEAAACGLPTIATTVGGTPEIIDDGHTGWLVPPAQPELLGRAVAECLDNPDMGRRRGLAACAHVSRNFSLERAAASTAAIYREILQA